MIKMENQITIFMVFLFMAWITFALMVDKEKAYHPRGLSAIF